MTFKRQLLYGLACVPCIAIPAIANAQAAAPAAQSTASPDAQNTLQEVVITAERRTSNIQKTPASVSVRSGEELQDQGRITTREILQDVPGVVSVDNNSRNLGTSDVQGNNISIRGISASNSAAGGISGISAAAGAAVYVDGVYEGIGGGYDIQRVEVLRGPQGTLYGRSATTGVVAFYTRDPALGRLGGDASVEVGNYDLQHYAGAINVPVGDKLAVRVSGDYYDQGEGYYGEATRGDLKREDGRVKLLWKPIDDFSLLVGGAYEKRDDFGGGKSYFASLPSLVQQAPVNSVLVPGGKEDKQFWAQANWTVGPVTLTYLPAYRSWTQNDTSINVNMFNTGLNSRTTQKTPKDDFWTHEFRIANNSDAGGIKWQAGLFYYDNNLANSVLAQFETPAGVPGAITTQSSDTRDTRNIGVFAETTIPLKDSLRLTLGGRYDDTQVLVGETLYQDAYQLCGNGIGVKFPLPPGVVCTGVGTASAPSPPATTISGVKLHFNEFSYKARLEYDVTPKNMLYGMISTAYRPGDAGIQNGAPFLLADQKLTSIELGSKNRFLNDKLQVNASLFHYNYQGFQVLYQTDIFVPISFVNTTVPATNIGGELEALYRLTQHDRIGLDASYVQSHWYNKPAGFQAAYPQTNRAMTPWTINGNFTHVFNLSGGSTLSARIDGQYQAAHQSTDLQAQYSNLVTPWAPGGVNFNQYAYLEPRLVGNLSAVWTTGRYALSAYVRNFTNVHYKQYTVSTNTTRLGLDWSDPLTFGAQLAVHF